MPSRVYRDDLLEGRVAVVTGGGTGIGAGCARELTRVGAKVVIASRKEANLRRAAEGLTAELGVEVAAEPCDIRDREAVARLYRNVLDRFGRVDILVNNGGGQFLSPAEAIPPRGWDAVVATNLTGTWNMVRGAADTWMLEHGGAIVNVTMTCHRTFPGMAHSAAARSGVESFTRTVAVEWASRGVRVNCVAPGYILSSGFRNYPPDPNLFRGAVASVPMKRFGTVDEVAGLVTWLVSPAAAYVTGQTWTIDGGKELWGDFWPIPDPETWPDMTIPREPWEEEEDP